MKVLQACTRFPPAPGGAEMHVLSISKELVSRGYDLKVYTSDLYMEIPFKRMESWEPLVKNVPVQRFKAYTMGGNLHYLFIPAMTRAILSYKADVIHTHSYGYFQNNVSGLNKKLRDTPFVITTHYHPPWSMWGGPKRKQIRQIYDKLIAPSVIHAADIIIGVSHHEIELLNQVIPLDEAKIRYIPNGIPFEKYDPIPDPAPFIKKYNPSRPLILYVGRLASNKGLETLVESAPAILKEFPNATFALVGEDEGMKAILTKNLKKLGISKNFIFTGHITDDELFHSSFSACDLFVLPSEWEAFGIVLCEAMACEKPCVGTRVGGVPEVIGKAQKTGLIVEYGNARQLSDAIIELLSDDKRRMVMGKAGRKRVKAKFTWKKVVDQIEEVYKEIT